MRLLEISSEERDLIRAEMTIGQMGRVLIVGLGLMSSPQAFAQEASTPPSPPTSAPCFDVVFFTRRGTAAHSLFAKPVYRRDLAFSQDHSER